MVAAVLSARQACSPTSLDHERVSAGAGHGGLQCFGRDISSGFPNGHGDRRGDLLGPNGAEVAPVGAAQECGDLIGEQVVDSRGQAGTHEGDVAALTEGVLDRGPELAEIVHALAVDLVDGDEDPAAAPFGQEVGQQVQLGPQTRPRGVPLGNLPIGAESAWQGDAGEARPGLAVVDLAEEAR
ncbi:hypothetical protein [Nocardioides convexus]|uniref:hypothetical protein n=1 Tax=Nocardioides convexus TaxID=2712224 RepID=UPI002418521B|nr:hypothetical protein [Nocardioides convexus]